MSQLTDLGVTITMGGQSAFESSLKSIENQFKSLSGAFEKAPEFSKHFEKVGHGFEKTQQKITHNIGLIKTAVIGLMTAKAGSGLLNWALGNEATSEAKSFNVATMGTEQREKYLETMSRLRKENKIAKEDLEKGVYQTDTAMSGKPLEQSIGVLETLPYYMKLTGKSFEESAKFVKSFYASFGDSLPIEQQATYAKDTLGQLMQVAKISKSDPQQIMESLGRLGALYSSMGLSQAHMFADVSSLTPRMGGSTERAATAITTIIPRSSEIAQKFAKSDYEEKFSRGQVFDNTGRSSRNWGSLDALERANAEGNEQAKKSLDEMKRNSDIYGKSAARKAEQFLKDRDPYGLMNYLNELVEKNKSNPLAQKVLRDAFGEHSNAMLAWLDDYKRGEITRLEKEYGKPTGDSAIGAIKDAQNRELPHLMSLVKQGADDFSTNLRSVFYEPMKFLLEEWQTAFQNINASFGGENGAKKLQALGAAIVQGHKDVVAPGSISDTRSVGQLFEEWVTSLNAEDFRSASRQVSLAASDFLTAASMLKQIVTRVHAKYNSIFPAEPKSETSKPVLGGYFDFDFNKSLPGWLLRGAPATEQPALDGLQPQGLQPQGLGPDFMVPSHGRSSVVAPPDSMLSAHTPGALNGNISARFDAVNVNVSMDGDDIAKKLTPRVTEDVMGRLEAEQDRNRSNANDKPLMGN